MVPLGELARHLEAEAVRSTADQDDRQGAVYLRSLSVWRRRRATTLAAVAPSGSAKPVARGHIAGRTYDSLDPFTGEPWARVPDADGGDVDRAVDAARAAVDGP